MLSIRPLLLVVLVGAAMAAHGEALAGKLSRAASSVDAPSSNEHRDRDDRRRNRRCDCDDDDDGFLDLVVTSMLNSMFSGDDDCDDEVYAPPPTPSIPLYFAQYPYELGYPGYMAPASMSPSVPYTSSRQVWVDYGTNFDGIQSIGTQLRMESSGGLGFDARWRNYFEDLNPGTDNLGLGGLGGYMRIASGERGSARIGIGVPMMQYDSDFDAGLTLNGGFDLFPTEPWIISFDAEVGAINQSSFTRLRPTIGYAFRRSELITGVEYVKFDDVDFTNMIFGLRLWW